MTNTQHAMTVTGIVVVLLALMFIGDGCSKRTHEFRAECARNGGTLIAGPNADNCVNQGRVTTRS